MSQQDTNLSPEKKHVPKELNVSEIEIKHVPGELNIAEIEMNLKIPTIYHNFMEILFELGVYDKTHESLYDLYCDRLTEAIKTDIMNYLGEKRINFAMDMESVGGIYQEETLRKPRENAI